MSLRPWSIALGLCAALGCSHHALDTSMSGHRTQNLRAEAQKVENGWRVTLQLPTWAQYVLITLAGGGPTIRIKQD